MSETKAQMETEPELAGAATAAAPTTTILAGVSGLVDPDLLRERALALARFSALADARITLAYPGSDTHRTPLTDRVDLLSYPLPTAEGASSPWAQTAAAEAALLAMAAEQQAHTTVLLHPDLSALTPTAFTELAAPVQAGQADLVMASYQQGPFDSLLNHAVLAPLNRALYGKRVRFPLAPDLALSPRMAARLAISGHSAAGTGTPVLWPTTVAAGIDATVAEVELPLQHPSPAAELELSAVLAQLVGSCFAGMEAHAPLWQRVRPAAPVATAASRNGGSFNSINSRASAAPIDTAPMVSSFLLGSRSLQSVWGMVLPPVTLLDLKRLTQLTPGNFRMPDELWVRILYDFALGYRLRTINRVHLLGALTPLYLGWVASYINEATVEASFGEQSRYLEERTERLARAFEDGKPYLVRRWRWPDRFNP